MRKREPKPGILYAAEVGDLEDLRAHLRAGADPNTIWKTGITPLMGAAFEGHRSICKELLRAGANLDLYDTEMGWSAVHDAVRGGHPSILRLFLEAGADVLEHERRGGSLLCLAAGAPQHAAKLTADLLRRGCDPNLKGNGFAPLDSTPPAGNLRAAEILVAHGADPRAISDEGFSVWDSVVLNYEGSARERWRRVLGLSVDEVAGS